MHATAQTTAMTPKSHNGTPCAPKQFCIHWKQLCCTPLATTIAKASDVPICATGDDLPDALYDTPLTSSPLCRYVASKSGDSLCSTYATTWAFASSVKSPVRVSIDWRFEVLYACEKKLCPAPPCSGIATMMVDEVELAKTIPALTSGFRRPEYVVANFARKR